MSQKEIVWDYLKKHPFAQTKQISDATGISGRAVRKAKSKWASAGNHAPQILLFDIETSPMEVFVWGLYKQRINPDNVIKDWSVLSWSAKWLFDDHVMGDVVTGEDAIEREDWRILGEMWELLNEADIVIGHYSSGFDHPKLNARFILNDMSPPMPYQVIDTKKVASKHFSFSSNKLDYLSKLFMNKKKISTDFGLWKRCVAGSDEALSEMLEYNRMDVLLLEEVYLELRPWIKSHPNMGLYVEGGMERCANCGDAISEVDWRGFYYTPAGRYKAYRCKECGAIGRSRYSDLKVDERKNLTLSVAR